jgi:hypothetical protein
VCVCGSVFYFVLGLVKGLTLVVIRFGFRVLLVGAIVFVVVWDLLLVVELGGTDIWHICSHNVVCMMINGYASANITW